MAKNWDKDFRFAAIQASLGQVGDSLPDDPFDHPFSFCLPINEKPISGLLTPGRFTLLMIVIGFLLLGSGAWLAFKAEQAGNSWPLLSVGLVCCLSGMACFFSVAVCLKPLLKHLLGNRADELIGRAGAQKIYCAEVGDSANPGISIEGDDFALMWFDKRNERLLVEGFGARYQIRRQDAISVEEFNSMNYLGADIVYRIDEHTNLRIGIAASSTLYELYRQLPFLFFLKKLVRNSILEEALATIEPPAEG